MLFESAVRVSDLSLSDVTEVDFGERTLRICQGKGAKNRLVLITPGLGQLLQVRLGGRTHVPLVALQSGHMAERPTDSEHRPGRGPSGGGPTVRISGSRWVFTGRSPDPGLRPRTAPHVGRFGGPGGLSGAEEGEPTDQPVEAAGTKTVAARPLARPPARRAAAKAVMRSPTFKT